jgi:5'(3')-deoxyribonucleotidase
LIDADEVLINFVDRAAEIISEVQGKPWTLEDTDPKVFDIFYGLPTKIVDECFRRFGEKGYCASLDPIEGAPEFIRRVMELYDVNVITTPNHTPYWYYERVEWLRKRMGVPPNQVTFTYTKELFEGDFFLDDCPTHVLKWQEAHPRGLGMMWTSPNNSRLSGYDSIRVCSWDEVLVRASEHERKLG